MDRYSSARMRWDDVLADGDQEDARFRVITATCVEMYDAGGLPELLRFAVAASVLLPIPTTASAPDVAFDVEDPALGSGSERDEAILAKLLGALEYAYRGGGTAAALHELAGVGACVRRAFEAIDVRVWNGLVAMGMESFDQFLWKEMVRFERANDGACALDACRRPRRAHPAAACELHRRVRSRRSVRRPRYK